MRRESFVKAMLTFACVLTAILIGVLCFDLMKQKKVGFPSVSELVNSYQNAGYEVTVTDEIGDVKGINHIVCTKGTSLADFVCSRSDVVTEAVLKYYGDNYPNSFIVGNRSSFGLAYMYYASDEAAWDVAHIVNVKKADSDIIRAN